MAEMSKVIQKLDRDIEAYISASEKQNTDERMKKLEYYTALRNGLGVMPLNAPQVDALAHCDNLLTVADRVFSMRTDKAELRPDYTELSFCVVDDVYHTERMNLLRYKIAQNITEYKNSLLELPPEKIVESAYEYTLKNELYLLVDSGELSTRQIDALLTLKEPLWALYNGWLQCDISLNDALQDSIKLSIQKQENYLKRQDFITHGETPSEDISIWNAMYDGDDMRFNGEGNETDEDLEQ